MIIWKFHRLLALLEYWRLLQLLTKIDHHLVCPIYSNQDFASSKGIFSSSANSPFSIKVWFKLSLTTATQTERPITTRAPRTSLILFINLRNGRVCRKVWRNKGWRVGGDVCVFSSPQSFLWPWCSFSLNIEPLQIKWPFQCSPSPKQACILIADTLQCCRLW